MTSLLAAAWIGLAVAAASAAPEAGPVAVLPCENLSGVEAPVDAVQASLRLALQDRGLDLLPGEALEEFIRRQRMRDVGGLAGGMGEALRAGGIHYRVGGHDKASVLHAVVDTMKLPEDLDPEFLYQVLLAREALGSTGVGDGIAIPHVRNPIVLHLSRPSVSLCFLERPVDFGALDGQPVSALFTLVSPTVRAHLHLLSRLAFALRDARFLTAVRTQASREEIFAALQAAEAAVSAPPAEVHANAGGE